MRYAQHANDAKPSLPERRPLSRFAASSAAHALAALPTTN